MTETSPPAWGGDPSIAWRILLTAVPAPSLTAAELNARQEALHLAQGWPAPPPVMTGGADTVRREIAEVRDVPLVTGLAGDRLVISAFHAYVDGLGLLEVLAALAGGEVTSSARGVADRPAGRGSAALDRLREVALAPPARVAPLPAVAAEGDAFAEVAVPGRVRTADLVHAAVSAVMAHNEERGRGSRHVTVAVGAGRAAAPGERLANRSELIRLRDLEGLSREHVQEALRSAPLDSAGGSGASGGWLAAAAQRVLASRLGSTLLVSHLGDVTTAAARDLAFYPVTAGGTGLSLGAVGHAGRTVLTLRGRGSAWDAAGLDALLTRVARQSAS
ncbi:hypothetical protein [Nocardioides dilutus]